MGSGKSYLAKHLAKAMEFSLVELDARIEELQGISIHEIFTKHGEAYFRNQEYLEVQKIIESNEQQIVSLGGGTYCYEETHAIINNQKDAFTVYLQYEPSFLMARLKGEKEHRPIISSQENLEDFIDDHLKTREPFYASANLIISDETDIDKIVDQVISYMSYLNQKLSTI